MYVCIHTFISWKKGGRTNTWSMYSWLGLIIRLERGLNDQKIGQRGISRVENILNAAMHKPLLWMVEQSMVYNADQNILISNFPLADFIAICKQQLQRTCLDELNTVVFTYLLYLKSTRKCTGGESGNFPIHLTNKTHLKGSPKVEHSYYTYIL